MALDNASAGQANAALSQYLEQYKAYLADLGNVGSRYATTNGFYMSVISALLGVLALTDSPKLFGQIQKPTLLVVCMFSIALCAVWAQTIWFYRLLFQAKFDVLRQLEAHLAYPCFAAEYDIMKHHRAFWLTKIETFVPLVLALFFVAVALIRW